MSLKINPIEQKKLAYRINEATKVTGIGRTLIYELIKEGKLKSFKIAGCRLISADSLQSLLKTKSSETISGH